MARLCWVVLVGCSGSPGPVAHHAGAIAHCPQVKPDAILHGSRDPAWEIDPLGDWPKCLEVGDGAIAYTEKDTSDVDGWSERLIVRDGDGERFRRDIRAMSSFAIGADGGVAIAHVEDAASRFAPDGKLVWKTPHPYCGSPHIAVGYDERVVIACGYSVVAYTPDGRFDWQKWPFGNTSVEQPLIDRDGTIIVRSLATVAKLEPTGELRWRIDTGWNRYVMTIGLLPDGDLVFRTAMNEAHSEGDIHFYYDPEPDELFVVARDGRIVSRTTVDERTKAWPTSQPWTAAFRSGRI